MFKGVWGELESKKGFQRQPVTKYLRPTVFSCEVVHYRKRLISIFHEFFASINKTFSLAGELCTRLPFYKVEALS